MPSHTPKEKAKRKAAKRRSATKKKPAKKVALGIRLKGTRASDKKKRVQGTTV